MLKLFDLLWQGSHYLMPCTIMTVGYIQTLCVWSLEVLYLYPLTSSWLWLTNLQIFQQVKHMPTLWEQTNILRQPQPHQHTPAAKPLGLWAPGRSKLQFVTCCQGHDEHCWRTSRTRKSRILKLCWLVDRCLLMMIKSSCAREICWIIMDHPRKFLMPLACHRFYRGARNSTFGSDVWTVKPVGTQGLPRAPTWPPTYLNSQPY